MSTQHIVMTLVIVGATLTQARAQAPNEPTPAEIRSTERSEIISNKCYGHSGKTHSNVKYFERRGNRIVAYESDPDQAAMMAEGVFSQVEIPGAIQDGLFESVESFWSANNVCSSTEVDLKDVVGQVGRMNAILDGGPKDPVEDISNGSDPNGTQDPNMRSGIADSGRMALAPVPPGTGDSALLPFEPSATSPTGRFSGVREMRNTEYPSGNVPSTDNQRRRH